MHGLGEKEKRCSVRSQRFLDKANGRMEVSFREMWETAGLAVWGGNLRVRFLTF